MTIAAEETTVRGRKTSGEDRLAGTFEAHLILGVERSRIARFLDDNRRGKDKIPEPLDTLRCGPIWKHDVVIEAAKRMYAEAHSPRGATTEGFERWMWDRARSRADAVKPPLSDDELSEILGVEAP